MTACYDVFISKGFNSLFLMTFGGIIVKNNSDFSSAWYTHLDQLNGFRNKYEERNDLHPDIAETQAAEADIRQFLGGLDDDLKFEVDALIGRVARAYEMQGFLFGLNYCGAQT